MTVIINTAILMIAIWFIVGFCVAAGSAILCRYELMLECGRDAMKWTFVLTLIAIGGSAIWPVVLRDAREYRLHQYHVDKAAYKIEKGRVSA